MGLIILLIVLILLFGGGGFYYGGPYVGGGLGTACHVLIVMLLRYRDRAPGSSELSCYIITIEQFDHAAPRQIFKR